MPRIKRRAHRRKLAWGKGHVDQLLTGHSWFRDQTFGDESRGTFDEGLMRAWQELGPQLLAEWIAEHPGTRPWAWWVLAAPERRRRIGSERLRPGRRRGDDDAYEFIDDGACHPFDNPEREEKIVKWRQDYPEIADREAHRLSFGTPSSMMVLDDFEAIYESESEYLERLGLLTPGERKTGALA